jgi:hypothetical protein
MSTPDSFTLSLLRSDFVPWSAVIWRLRDCLLKLRAREAESIAARDLALRTFGEIAVEDIPALIDAAQFVIACDSRIVVHELRPAVVRLIDETDLHSVPGEPPRLLRRPFVLEARRPAANERLFANVASIVGYPDGAAINLFWSTYPDGQGCVVRWEPKWAEEELAAGPPPRPSPLIGDLEDLSGSLTIAGEAARFLIVVGLLLEADNAPLQIKDEDRKFSTADHGRSKATSAGSTHGKWITRHLFLDDHRSARKAQTPATSVAAWGDRLAEERPVRGHLKRQPYGVGLAKTRWIWVDRYEARRWVAPGSVRVVVDAQVPASEA